MQILMTGASGLIGRELGKSLVENGHTIVALTRNPQTAKYKLPFPAQCFEWHGLKSPPPLEAFANVQAIIHLVGEGIADRRWSEQRKAELYDSRVITTKNLLAGLEKSGARIQHWISASATGIYSPTDAIQTEKSPTGTGFLAELCKDWEAASQRLTTFSPQTKMTWVRISPVLARGGGFLGQLEPLFLDGLGSQLGNGQQYFSFIHIEDLCKIFVAALAGHVAGIVNACAPHPVTNAQFTRTYAETLKRRTFLPVPQTAIEVIYGELASVLFASQNIISEKLSPDFFQFPNLAAALKNLYPEAQAGEEQAIFEQWLPLSIEDVFSFYESEGNLEEITPPFLNFKVLKKSTPQIQVGTLIDYRLSYHGVPIHWQTRIESFKKNDQFVDSQLRGPFKKWYHVHTFRPFAGGTLCRDLVTFALPAGWIGRVFGSRFVRNDVQTIFNYRRKVIGEKFAGNRR